MPHAGDPFIPEVDGGSRSRGPRAHLPHYAAFMAGYAGIVAGGAVVVRRRSHEITQVTDWSELLLVGLATHRLSRLVSKSKIASPLRAPFTTHEGPAGPGEVNDVPVGPGWRRGVGELVSCPFCLDVWIATSFTFARLLAPRGARVALAVAGATAVADFLHFGYVIAEHRAES